MRRAFGFNIALILSLAFMLTISSCSSYREYDPGSETSGIGSPPPWETAHGVGAEQHYYYYPQVKIYFNLEREVYYYYYAGQWQVASQLPNNVKLSGRSVSLGMKEEEPYKWQTEIEKRYPPEPE